MTPYNITSFGGFFKAEPVFAAATAPYFFAGDLKKSCLRPIFTICKKFAYKADAIDKGGLF